MMVLASSEDCARMQAGISSECALDHRRLASIRRLLQQPGGASATPAAPACACKTTGHWRTPSSPRSRACAQSPRSAERPTPGAIATTSTPDSDTRQPANRPRPRPSHPPPAIGAIQAPPSDPRQPPEPRGRVAFTKRSLRRIEARPRSVASRAAGDTAITRWAVRGWSRRGEGRDLGVYRLCHRPGVGVPWPRMAAGRVGPKLWSRYLIPRGAGDHGVPDSQADLVAQDGPASGGRAFGKRPAQLQDTPHGHAHASIAWRRPTLRSSSP
jgi:hypothetical protein